MITSPPQAFGYYGQGEFDISMTSSHEWHSRPIALAAGDTFTVTILGNDRFYAGLFSREFYVRYRGTGVGGAFGFNFGADRVSFTDRVHVTEPDDFYLVIRVGRFTPGQTTLKLRWSRTQE